MNRLRRISKHVDQPEARKGQSGTDTLEPVEATPAEPDSPKAENGMPEAQNGLDGNMTMLAGAENVAPADMDLVADAAPEAMMAEDELVEDREAAPTLVDAQAEALVADDAGLQEEIEPEEMGTSPLGTSGELHDEELTPLPANAVVNGRYVVQSQLHHGVERNLYRVAARRQQKCIACGRLSSVDAQECEHCGAALTNEQPADFYLMAESFQPDALMQDPDLMELKLYHPNLVPVVDFYEYTPFGRARYYAVAEPRQGVRLSQLSLPRPGLQVFGWGLQLADALDYLHSRGVVGAGAEADDILVQGDMASLASLQNARISPEDSAERTQLQGIDLAKLAATIYEAYTGHQAAMSPEGILPMPSQAPDKVGAALRAAIEPVQGITPPITAAEWRDMLSSALISIAELEQPGRPVNFVSASLSDVGRLRDQNQDSFCTIEFDQSSVERPMRVGLFVVADGMGGHKGGEVASALAAQVFSAEVMSRVMSPLATATGSRPALTNEAILQGMARAVQSANERIYKARDSSQNDMGTTIVAALIVGGKAFIINVGDSRLYFYTQRDKGPEQAMPAGLVNIDATAPLKVTASLEEVDNLVAQFQPENYALTQVSVDHSLVHRLVELGQLDPEEAKVHPHRNFIYRSLGGPPPIEVDTFVRTLHPGDRLLLCSDGLNSMIEDSDIEATLRSESDPNMVCRRLIELANEAGGHDNITTLLIGVTDYLPLPEHPQTFN